MYSELKFLLMSKTWYGRWLGINNFSGNVAVAVGTVCDREASP